MSSAAAIALTGLTALTLSRPARAAAPAPEVLVETDHARVVGLPEDRALADDIAALIDEAVPRIAPLVGTDDLRPVTARIYDDRARFLAATGIPRQVPVVGLATFPSALLHIDGTGLLASIEKVVPHEVAHVMIARAVGPALPSLPIWLNEGLAEYAAGERAARVDPASLRAIGKGDIIPLADLDAAFRSRRKSAGLAYIEAASLVHFIIAERGETVVPALLLALRGSRDFEAALRQVTGWTTADLEAEWRRSLSRRWRWPLLIQSPLLPFGLMLLLFIAGLIRYLRERRRRQEMPDEDW